MALSSAYRCGVDLHRPVLSDGEVAGTLIDLQGALTRAFTLILLHSELKKTEQFILKVFPQIVSANISEKKTEIEKNVQKKC